MADGAKAEEATWQRSMLELAVEPTDAPCSIQIFVKDDDKIGKNDPLGDCSVDLTQLEPNKGTELTLPLQNVAKGELVIEVTWCPLDS